MSARKHIVLGILLLASACGRSASDPIYGLRLGVAPEQAREHFRPGAPGAFRTELDGEDMALVE